GRRWSNSSTVLRRSVGGCSVIWERHSTSRPVLLGASLSTANQRCSASRRERPTLCASLSFESPTQGGAYKAKVGGSILSAPTNQIHHPTGFSAQPVRRSSARSRETTF